jgi:hypothetical protein
MNMSKEEPNVASTEATTEVGKPSRPLNYPCHICGIIDHKLMNCPNFSKMQTMFKDKGGNTIKSKLEVKIVDA